MGDLAGGEGGGKKRGPKSKDEKIVLLQEVVAALRAEVAVLSPQVAKRQSDWAERQEMLWNEKVQKLEREAAALKSESDSLRRDKNRMSATANATDAQLAALRIEHVGALADITSAMNAKMQDASARADKVLRCAKIETATKVRMIDSRDAKLSEGGAEIRRLGDALMTMRSRCETAELVSADVPVLEKRCSDAETRYAERGLVIKRLCGKLGGRPGMTRTDDELGDCPQSTASHCKASMTSRLLEVLGDGEMATVSVVAAIVDGGYLEAVWESEVFWDLRMEWASEKRDDLSLAWNADLSLNIRDKLVVSYDKFDELRFMLSHHRVGKRLVPRTWFVNPWDGRRLSFPQPIRPRSGLLGWARLVSESIKRHGLTMDSQGRVAQRSYADTVIKQVERDVSRKLLRPLTAEDPLISVLGADGTGVGKRSLMHVACSVAPSYRDGISVENEKNINTVAASITDDHWGGLNETLCGGYYTGVGDSLPPGSIAAEVNGLIATQCLECPSFPDQAVPVRVRGCFDLVAARGIRGGRGRCACHVEAATAERFDTPPITDQTTWNEAAKMLQKRPTLTAAGLRDDAHTPPEDWDWTHPWRCKRPGCHVEFTSLAEFREARAAFRVLKALKGVAAKKVSAERAKAYAILHPSEQGEFEPPLTDLDLIDIIIDPLHCCLLNLPKVIWKYVFGDRMNNEQRELVAEYLTDIGCPLDVRAKGDGRDANRKWFTGEVFQRFVEGDMHRGGSSPGLAENIKALMDIIYLKAPAAPGPADPADPADPAPAVPIKNTTAQIGRAHV